MKGVLNPLVSGLTMLVLLLPLRNIAQREAGNPFQPMNSEWPSPSETRLASGAPGPAYWQQRADYQIQVSLDEKARSISGTAQVCYQNNSPHTLDYLWLQLDQNIRNPHSLSKRSEVAGNYFRADMLSPDRALMEPFPGGLKVSALKWSEGKEASYRIVDTNLRLNLEEPLKPGKKICFDISWSYNINNAVIEGRSGYEHFIEDGNDIFEIAQFFPRMCAYDDIEGWQNKPFYGPAEFALEFGDYEVEIEVPADFVVAATGELKNADEVLSATQMERLEKMRSQEGVKEFIITPDEAEANSASRSKGRKSWKFEAKDVRDFAFAASRKFAWDAAAIRIGEKQVIAQSFYPKEGMPLWDKFATHAVIHTLQSYSSLLFDYPYPQATAVHGAVWGMEYPMMAFCGGRPSSSGFYSRYSKFLMIGVVIHEVGHNFFPMIVNSDERAWAWMDEGLNSFCQYLTEQSFEANFPHRRGPAGQISGLLNGRNNQPIMTNPESIRDNGGISYEKTTVGLKILRDQVMGPEVFDMAFRDYARRWAFKRPRPADFFRSMAEGSGMNLDWFWRSWFYGDDPMDFSLEKVTHFLLPEEEGEVREPTMIPIDDGPQAKYYTEGKPELKDRYSGQSPSWNPSEELEEWSLTNLLESGTDKDDPAYHIYRLEIKNVGGCILPVIIDAFFKDGSRERYRLPAEVWNNNPEALVKEIHSNRAVAAFIIDAGKALPDANRENNYFPKPAEGVYMEEMDLRKED